MHFHQLTNYSKTSTWVTHSHNLLYNKPSNFGFLRTFTLRMWTSWSGNIAWHLRWMSVPILSGILRTKGVNEQTPYTTTQHCSQFIDHFSEIRLVYFPCHDFYHSLTNSSALRGFSIGSLLSLFLVLSLCESNTKQPQEITVSSLNIYIGLN